MALQQTEKTGFGTFWASECKGAMHNESNALMESKDSRLSHMRADESNQHEEICLTSRCEACDDAGEVIAAKYPLRYKQVGVPHLVS